MTAISEHQQPQRRSNEGGFILVDALISLALAAGVLTLIYAGYSFAQQAPRRALAEYHRGEVALSILEEASLRYPDYASSGQVSDHWEWRLDSRERPPLAPTPYDSALIFHDITVTVWEIGHPDIATSYSLTIKRKRAE